MLVTMYLYPLSDALHFALHLSFVQQMIADSVLEVLLSIACTVILAMLN